uniref:BspA family leucine-rich repeat surface protein n=1 Tax=Proboscia inermis TaxID=420281 RepID=A0A7S0GFK1_9STRA|mmetsp:Transcript_31113/g.31392  ORF Transcript_31113/g.31392 Transcript_31113/m.31392 type:complete len:197 (+) Transcript_31113:37-627(+)
MPFNASPCNIFMLRLLIAVCALFQCAQGEDQLTRLYSERNPKHADIVTVNIRKAVIEYVLDEEYAVKRYGPIESWDTSEVTDMSYLFFHGRCSENSLIDICIKRLKNFDEDISAWDVSSVTKFESMFFSSERFNADISAWDTSNAENMSRFFYGSRAFNADISAWDVNSVTENNMMLKGATSFVHDLTSWTLANTN